MLRLSMSPALLSMGTMMWAYFVLLIVQLFSINSRYSNIFYSLLYLSYNLSKSILIPVNVLMIDM